jgi:hypothetical protein
MKKIFLLCSFVYVSTVGAALFKHTCLDQFDYTLSGDYLLLLPTYGTPTYATNLDNGTPFQNRFGFTSGFRVKGECAYTPCDRYFEATYMRLHSTSSESATGANIVSSVFNLLNSYSGTLFSDITLTYQDGHAYYHQPVFKSFCSYIDAGMGFEVGDIRFTSAVSETLDAEVFDLPSSWNERSNLVFFGPQLGVTGAYRFLKAGTYASLLAAKQQSYNKFLITVGDFANLQTVISQNDYWKVVPSWKLFAGAEFLTCLCECFPLSIEVGYEFHYFANAILRQFFQRVAISEGVENLRVPLENQDFTAQGLYVNFKITF